MAEFLRLLWKLVVHNSIYTISFISNVSGPGFPGRIYNIALRRSPIMSSRVGSPASAPNSLSSRSARPLEKANSPPVPRPRSPVGEVQFYVRLSRVLGGIIVG
jgi:hypothetical protein